LFLGPSAPNHNYQIALAVQQTQQHNNYRNSFMPIVAVAFRDLIYRITFCPQAKTLWIKVAVLNESATQWFFAKFFSTRKAVNDKNKSGR